MSASCRVVLSGCSGGGKSTMIAELARRGHATFAEPGRRLVEGGLADPLADPEGFAVAAIGLALADHAAAPPGLSFFDRAVLDGLNWFAQTATPLPAALRGLADSHRYFRRVYMTPPWPAIFVQDAARRHELSAGQAEYVALCLHLPAMGYDPVDLPLLPVARRVDWLLADLAGLSGDAGSALGPSPA